MQVHFALFVYSYLTWLVLQRVRDNVCIVCKFARFYFLISLTWAFYPIALLKYRQRHVIQITLHLPYLAYSDWPCPTHFKKYMHFNSSIFFFDSLWVQVQLSFCNVSDDSDLCSFAFTYQIICRLWWVQVLLALFLFPYLTWLVFQEVRVIRDNVCIECKFICTFSSSLTSHWLDVFLRRCVTF